MFWLFYTDLIHTLYLFQNFGPFPGKFWSKCRKIFDQNFPFLYKYSITWSYKINNIPLLLFPALGLSITFFPALGILPYYPPKQKLENTSYTAIIWLASNEPKTCTKLKNDCILSNFMKSWLNKVPLFFWYHAYLILFLVLHFVPLPNLQINLSLKDLVLRI